MSVCLHFPICFHGVLRDNFTVPSTNVLGLIRLNELHFENKWICPNCTVFAHVLELIGICQCMNSEIFLPYEYFVCGQ
jgi:hypothetical protein